MGSFPAHIGSDDIQHACLRSQHGDEQRRDDDPGKKMRKIDHSLGNALEGFAAYLVKHNRQDDRHREADRQIQQVKFQRLQNHADGLRFAEQIIEIV